MESARDLVNLSFAHEIIVNRKFHLEPDSLPQDKYVSWIQQDLVSSLLGDLITFNDNYFIYDLFRNIDKTIYTPHINI